MRDFGPRGPHGPRDGGQLDAAPVMAPGRETLTSKLPPMPAQEQASEQLDGAPGAIEAPAADGALFDGDPQWEVIQPDELALDGGLGHQPLNASTPTHAPASRRVADAGTAGKSPEINVVIKVLAIRGGKIVKQWQAKGHWDGPLPRTYTGTRSGAGWQWDDPSGKSVKVNTQRDGRGGQSVEAWAGGEATRIVVYAQPIDAVTSDRDAKPDDHEPGHGTEKRNAGDGTPQESTGGREVAKGGKEGSKSGDGKQRDGELDGEARDEDMEPGPEDDAIVAEFERELGIDDDIETDPDAEGEGGIGGDPDGRTGPDTRVGSDGPGGEDATSDGKGAKPGRDRDSEADGSPDARKRNPNGDPEGLYGGEGRVGDRGVRNTPAILGGLLSVPAALRGLVEVILLASSGDLAGLGAALFKKLFKSSIKRFATAAALRTAVASEARRAAVVETKAAIKRVANTPAYKALSKAERDQLTRVTYWELQRKYFEGFQAAARRAKWEAKAALKKGSRAEQTAAKKRVEAAEMADEAAEVKPVAGRLPRNHQYAGREFPRDMLPAQYRKQGLKFTKQGYPDFEPYAKTLPNGKKSVTIDYKGSPAKDFDAANEAAGLTRTPQHYTWHHSEDLGKMMLIPKDLHNIVKHTGGVAGHKHVTGIAHYGK